jgi:hypothetical protein
MKTGADFAAPVIETIQEIIYSKMRNLYGDERVLVFSGPPKALYS